MDKRSKFLTHANRKAIGPYAGNAGANPAFTCSVDYFFNTASPITPEDPTAPVPASITQQPHDTTVNEGQTAVFIVVATGSPTPTYQWQKNNVDISGATNASYTTPATIFADNGAAFRCIVSNASGTVTSNAALLTVNQAGPTISQQPTNQSVQEGATAAFSVTATGSPTLAYQWQRDNINIGGATNSSYNTGTLSLGDNGTAFRCIVSNSVGSVTSNPATLTVSTQPAGTVVSDDFSSGTLNASLWTYINPNPSSTLSFTGVGTSNALLSIALPAGGTGHDVWQGGNQTPRILQTITNQDFTVEAKFQSLPVLRYQFQGILVQQDINNFIRFDLNHDGNVLRLFAASFVGNSPTTRINAPVTPGNTMWLRVNRSGNTWIVSHSVNGTTFITDGTFNHTLTVSAVGPFGGNASGSSSPAFTMLCDYFFNTAFPIPEDPTGPPPAPVITTQPTSQSVFEGQTAIFSIAASGQNLSYQWQKNDVNVGGATSVSYSTAAALVDSGSSFRCIVSNPGGSVTSNAAILSVNRIPPTITAQPADSTVVSGSGASFTVTATGSNPIFYQWQRDSVDIPGGTNSTYAVPSTIPADSGASFRCIVSNGAGSVTSAGAVLHVLQPPIVVTQPSDQTVPLGDAATFTVVADGTMPLSYQWQRGGADIFAATNPSYTTPATIVADSGTTFRCIVTNLAGSDTSFSAVLSVNTAAQITQQPQAQTVSTGQAATFTIRAAGTAPLSYQWQKNDTSIVGATDTSFTIPSVISTDSGMTYRCIVSNALGADTSVSVVLHVVQPAHVTSQPLDQSILAGEAAVFSVVAEGTVPLSYQWQKDSVDISGATNGSYTTPTTTAADSGTTFRCIVTNVAGSDTSLSAVLSVSAPARITLQPQSQIVSTGKNATFIIQASGTFPLSYQWMRSDTVIAGASDTSYTTPQASPADSGTAFKCIASNSFGVDTSLIALLHVVQPPQITSQPLDRTVLVGQIATFNILAGGTAPLSYQWQKNDTSIVGAIDTSYATEPAASSDSGATFRCIVTNPAGSDTSLYAVLSVNAPAKITQQPASLLLVAGQTGTFTIRATGTAPLSYEWLKNDTSIIGATDTVFTTPAATQVDSGTTYRCIVSNAFGSDSSVYAFINIATPPHITLQAENDTVLVGDTASFTVTASGTQPLVYQWQKNNVDIGGAIDSAYNTLPTMFGDLGTEYRCIVSNSFGADTSAIAILVVHSPPVILGAEGSGPVPEGQPAAFHVSATGTSPLSFQWLQNDLPISLATDSMYVISSTVLADSGAQLQCIVSNPYGADTTDTMILRIGLPPLITSNPDTQMVILGESATFGIAASGSLPIAYQWQKNGVNIFSGIDPVLILPSVIGADSNSLFRCIVLNDYGIDTSAVALLSVLGAPPAIVIQPLPLSVMAGSNAMFLVVAEGSRPLMYQWQKNNIDISGETDSVHATSTTSLPDNGAIFRCVVYNSFDTVFSNPATLTVTSQPPGSIVSDDFHTGTLNTSLWTYINPAPASTLGFTGVGTSNALLSMALPAGGTGHDVWGSGNQTPRILQTIANQDFTVEAKFQSLPTLRYQFQGILVQQDINNFVRFDLNHDGNILRLFSASFVGGSPTVRINTPVTPGSTMWLRVNRSGNTWTVLHSVDGTTFISDGTFSHTLTVSAVGPFGGNAAGSSSPAYTMLCDYFISQQYPLINEDPTPPVIVQQPVNQSVGVGNPATFSVTASGAVPLAYQWQRNGFNIAGAVDSTYAISLVTAADSGSTFRCLVYNSLGSVTSDAAMLLTIVTPPTIVVHPFNETRQAGQLATFSIQTGGTPPFQFQWQKNGIDVSGVISSSFTTDSLLLTDNGAVFRCIVSNAYGSATSNPAVLTVTAPPLSIGPWVRHVVDPARPARAVFIFPADFDRDGLQDIVTGAWWYRNPGTPGGTWVRSEIGSPLTNVAAVGDFDNDGWPDVVGTVGPDNYVDFSADSVQFVWARNNGNGTFTIHQNLAKGFGNFLQGSAVGSLQNGGPQKIVLSWQNPAVGVQTFTIPPDPVNTTWQWTTIFPASQGEAVSIGDIDRDGDMDLLLGTRWLRNEGVNWTQFQLLISNAEVDRSRLVDMNGDGKLDAVVCYQAESQPGLVAWYEQGSSPTAPWTEHPIATIIGPMSMDVADIEADGDFDVIVGEHNLVNPAIARQFVFENGDGVGGSWIEHVVYTGDEHHDGSQVTDMDGDGDLDIISIGWGHGNVLVYENRAIIGTGEPIPPHITSQPVVQIVQQGHSAAFTVQAAGSLPITFQWQRNGVNVPGATSSTYAIPSATAVDNGSSYRCRASNESGSVFSDGATLVVNSSGSSPVQWTYLSSATGDLPAPWGRTVEQTAAVAFDIDNDGLNDFILANRSAAPSVVWYKRTSSGWSRNIIESNLLSVEAGGAFYDIDGDGDLDLVLGGDDSSTEMWWWENPYPVYTEGTDWIRRTFKTGGGSHHHDHMFGDFDNDGKMDFVFWDRLAVGSEVMHIATIPDNPLTSGLWNYTLVYQAGHLSEGFTQADIDGDGLVDIVAAGYWFKHTSGTQFTSNVIDATQTFTQAAAAQLIPGGRPEVVFNSADGVGPLAWYDWNGTSWQRHDLLPYASFHGHSVDIVDFDNDGNLDIFAAEMVYQVNTDAEAIVFFGDGQGNFTQHRLSTGLDNHDSRVADLDGDGDFDILSKPFNFETPGVAVWLNNGTGTLRLPMNLWTNRIIDSDKPYRAIFEASLDLDGDGFKDIIMGGWWYKNPGPLSGTWTRRVFGAPMNQMGVVYDLDGDGDLDVFGTQGIAEQNNNNFAWARNDGGGNFTVLTNISSTSNATFLQGCAIGRFRPDSALQIILSWDNNPSIGLQALTVPSDPSTMTWTLETISPFTLGEAVAPGDIDRDGDVDLMLGTAWLRNEGTSWTPFVMQTDPTRQSDRVQLVDMDNDGDLDAVVGYGHDPGGKLAWYEQPADPTGTWPEHIVALLPEPQIPIHGVQSVSVVDMDLDGDWDIVAGVHNNPASGNEGLYIFENRDGVGGAWLKRQIESGEEHHDGALAVDIDDDGDMDIVSLGWMHPRVHLYENHAITQIPPLAPGITAHPQGAVVSPGSPVTFTVAAFGSQPLNYQWQRDSVDIPGAASPSYTITATTTQDSGKLFRCVVSNSLGAATSMSALLRTTSAANPSGIASDDFSAAQLNTSLWTFINPKGDASYSLVGTGTSDALLQFNIPAGTSHDVWSSNFAPRIMQPAIDSNFTIEAKFQSSLTLQYQLQGFIIEQDPHNYNRIDFVRNTSRLRVFSASITNDVPSVRIDVDITISSSLWLRVQRQGNAWTVSYSLNGTSYAQAGTYARSLVVSSVGVHAANHGIPESASPAFTCFVDYFFNSAAPIIPEDDIAMASMNKVNAPVLEDLPKTFELYQNYPNPFNPTTTMRYDVPHDEHVTITLYNILGQEVVTLVNEEKKAGRYSLKFDASNFASGIYLCRMRSGGFVKTIKLLAIK